MLLGAVAPYANRLSVERVADTGRTIGNLYAISTVGSLLGTFLAALLLIPTIGTHRTFIVFALALALVAVPGNRLLARSDRSGGRRRLAGDPAGRDRRGRGRRTRDLRRRDPLPVRARAAVLRRERWLQLNEGVAIHSVYRPGSYLTGGYWDDFLVLPLAAGAWRRRGASRSSATPREPSPVPTATTSRRPASMRSSSTAS